MTRILVDPDVIPPVPQKVFGTLWVRELAALMPTPFDSGRLVITWDKMSDTGELRGRDERIETDNLMRARDEVPEVRAAFDAFLAAVVPFQEWVAAQSQPPEPTPE
jgi:hypothetical protein